MPQSPQTNASASTEASQLYRKDTGPRKNRQQHELHCLPRAATHNCQPEERPGTQTRNVAQQSGSNPAAETGTHLVFWRCQSSRHHGNSSNCSSRSKCNHGAPHRTQSQYHSSASGAGGVYCYHTATERRNGAAAGPQTRAAVRDNGTGTDTAPAGVSACHLIQCASAPGCNIQSAVSSWGDKRRCRVPATSKCYGVISGGVVCLPQVSVMG